MKTVLAFETSSPVLSVALGTQDGKILEARARGLKHSENLIPLVTRLLQKGHLKLDEIDAFAIDRGPGSFTGLRIGFGFLKGFLAARKRPCYGAISLDMMTAPLRMPGGTRLGILLDARRGAVYSRFYRRLSGTWRAEGKLEILSLSEWKTRRSEETLLAGQAPAGLGMDLRPVAPGRARTLVEWFQSRDPRLVLLKMLREGEPLYLRASEAEENRKRKPRYHAR